MLPYANRPTISLALIAKNEEKNVARLLNSVDGCFDEIIFVDTGSTDKTKEIAEKYGCKMYDFEWINDFSAARNFAFSKVTCEYVAWLDLDDCLKNKEGFIKWRDTAMQFADVWLATYNYAIDKDEKPIINFVRERVFKVSDKIKWTYPIHEGVVINFACPVDQVPSHVWSVDHHRDAEDIAADKSRNITILETLRDAGKFDGRLKFYYGKELYESKQAFKAIDAFEQALKATDLQPHDKVLTYQYAAYACIETADSLKPELAKERIDLFHKALKFCLDGIAFDPCRAEYHSICGDIYLKIGDLAKAIPHYSAAKSCAHVKQAQSNYVGAVYSFIDCYGLNPSLQLAKIFAHIGKIDAAKKEAQECIDLYNSEEAKGILEEIKKMESLVTIDNNQEEVDEIVFTCPVVSAYEFDEELYKVKGMGGSETALIEVARHLKQITGKPVKVFAMREKDLVCESGVEYLSNKNLNLYFSKFKPKVHIAWRHNIKVTNAKTYLWCHDLTTPTVEAMHNFDKIMCLTEFHKNYVMGKQGVPEDKIIVTRNGLNPDKFKFERKAKDPNKLVWMSSPDRGLEQAMKVCDEVIKHNPSIELHVYYGLDNLYKFGQGALADMLKGMMEARPYVKYHGFTEQNKMYHEVSDAVVWVHPCNFIETFCITALEMLSLGIFPVTRRLGALQNTLSEAEKNGMAVMLNHDCFTEERVLAYAEQVKQALVEKKWENITFDIEKHSWKSVAEEWVKFMEL